VWCLNSELGSLSLVEFMAFVSGFGVCTVDGDGELDLDEADQLSTAEALPVARLGMLMRSSWRVLMLSR
jgi:hypothetical protein